MFRWSRRRLLLPLLFTLAVSPFQNCAPKSAGEKDQPSLQGNGSGYDGKTFVHVSARACADNKGFDAAIEGRGESFYLTRENCADIPAAAQTAVTVQTDPDNLQQIVYQERLFVERLMLTAPLIPRPDGFLSFGSTFEVVDGRLQNGRDYAARFDERGRKVWAKYLPSKGYLQIGSWADGYADGSMIAGVYFTETAAAPQIASLLRLSPTGKLLWSKELVPRGQELRLQSLRALAGGDALVTGTLHRSGQPRVSVLARVDKSGGVVFTRTIAGMGAASLHAAPDGTLYLSGALDAGGAVLMRLSADGGLVWSQVFSTYYEVAPYFAADGSLLLKAWYRVTPPEAPTVTVSMENYLRVAADGTPGAPMQMAGEEKRSGSFSHLYGGADGALYTTRDIVGGLRIIRMAADFSVQWAYDMPLEDDMFFSRFVRLTDGSFLSLLMKDSSLFPYNTDVLHPIDLARIPVDCTACVAVSRSMGPASHAATVLPGPTPAAADGLFAPANADWTPLLDADLALPLVK